MEHYIGAVNGYKVTGTNGNKIFIPAAGSREGTSLNGTGRYGFWWSGALHSIESGYAYELLFYSDYCRHYVYPGNRYDGHSVRPVRSK